MERAFALAEAGVFGSGDELARALPAQGRLAELEGDAEAAEQRYLEGEQSVPETGDHWPVFVALRTSRAMLLVGQANGMTTLMP